MKLIEIKSASLNDCHAIAELALIAGSGIPAYFWKKTQLDNETLLQTGARNAASETDNFSYRNTLVAIQNEQVMGMMLGYRLIPDNDEDLSELPSFIIPLIELEQCVPDSYYINMLGCYPQARNQGLGRTLMQHAEHKAQLLDCRSMSLEVFSENTNAIRLYKKLGYQITDSKKVIKHDCHPYSDKIYLMEKQLD